MNWIFLKLDILPKYDNFFCQRCHFLSFFLNILSQSLENYTYLDWWYDFYLIPDKMDAMMSNKFQKMEGNFDGIVDKLSNANSQISKIHFEQSINLLFPKLQIFLNALSTAFYSVMFATLIWQ